jgi:hypothetical protein
VQRNPSVDCAVLVLFVSFFPLSYQHCLRRRESEKDPRARISVANCTFSIASQYSVNRVERIYDRPCSPVAGIVAIVIGFAVLVIATLFISKQRRRYTRIPSNTDLST